MVFIVVLFLNLRRCIEDLWVLNILIGEVVFFRLYIKIFFLVEFIVIVISLDFILIEVRGDLIVIFFICL